MLHLDNCYEPLPDFLHLWVAVEVGGKQKIVTRGLIIGLTAAAPMPMPSGTKETLFLQT